MPRSCWVLVLLAFQQLSAANLCVSGNTLDTYEGLGGTGCLVGGLTVKDFVFSVVSSGGGATPIADTDITVITHFPVGGFGLEFQAAKFSVTGTQFVTYLIGFTWDPTGDMRTAGDILDPGPTDIITNLCIGAEFIGTSCAATPLSLHVFQGGPTQLTDSVNFAPTGLIGVRNQATLTNGGNFRSLENDVFVPEPGSLAGAVAALLVLRTLWRRRR